MADGDAMPAPDFEELEADAGGPAEAESGESGAHVGVHSSNFRDFLLKPELLSAITDCGFEHPSEVQARAIPQALIGMDVLSQAKSGMGKTAVFVLTTLNQLTPKDGECHAVVLAHTRELAFQICQEYKRFSKNLEGIKVAALYGGVPRRNHIELLEDVPHIVVGTPGRVKDMIENGHLKVDKVKFFVIDECDKMLEQPDMRRDVQSIFVKTPHDKQVMMFSATLAPEIRDVCLKFMQEPVLKIFVDSEEKLTLHGLAQFYVQVKEEKKTRQLMDLLDALEFNQVVIFMSSPARAVELDRLLRESNFPSIHMHGGMRQRERLERYAAFKKNDARILVSTNLVGRGIDIERVNVVINYDFPRADDKSEELPASQYLHRVGRAGRFGTKGLAISFVSSEEDKAALESVQERFAVRIPELPDEVDPKLYAAS